MILAEYLVEDSQFTLANVVLDSLHAHTRELQNLKDLKQINLTFAENNWTWFEITGEGQATEYEDSIRLIVEADSSLAAIQAQVILNLVFGDSIIRIWEEVTGSSKREENEQTNETVESKKDNLNYIVYPNPAKDVLNIKQYRKNEKDQAVFVLYDLMGQKVLEKELRETSEAINIANLNSGCYLYRVMTNEKVDIGGKVLIMK